MTENKNSPRLIVVMGVSGSGKSTVARQLASKLGYIFIEADDFHSDEAKAMMANGVALNDDIRWSWVERISSHLLLALENNQDCVLAWSALRREHRQIIRLLGFKTGFLYLKGEFLLIKTRLENRVGHFFDPALLESQFVALQEPTDEIDVIEIDLSISFPEVVQLALMHVNET